MSPSLTPVKVRGKKQSKSRCFTKSPPGQRSVDNRPSTQVSVSSSKPNTAGQTTNPPAANENLKPTASTSCLENLPTELLENIFFQCLNLSLPRASLSIGRKLASNHVKSHLVLNILGLPNKIDDPYPFATLLPNGEEYADAQTALLRLKWLTLPFFKSLTPDYVTHILVQELGPLRIRWMGDGPILSSASKPLIRQHLENMTLSMDKRLRAGSPVYWENSWAIPHRDRRQVSPSRHAPTDIDWREIFAGIGLPDGLVSRGTMWPGERRAKATSEGTWTLLSAVNGCQIPEKLLHGPWTDDKCEFLEIALRGGCSVDWVGTTSGEVAKQGLLQAIEEQNARAVEALVVRKSRYEAPDYFEYVDSENRPWTGGCRPRPRWRITHGMVSVGVVPTDQHLKKALEIDACNYEIIDVLRDAMDPDGEDCGREASRLSWCPERRPLVLVSEKPLGSL